jgi:hypothetical protein
MTNNLIKTAFIVEGPTEAFFVERLLTEILTEQEYIFEILKQDQTRKGDYWVTLKAADPANANTRYYFLIVSCCQDDKVVSYIREHRKRLLEEKYTLIVGLLDLYPNRLEELHDFQRGVKAYIPQKGLPTKFVISVMEIETWFIAETSHFQRINPELTLDLIQEKLGFDLRVTDFEDIEHPASFLDDTYKLVGKRYQKKEKQVKSTLDVLDFAQIYFSLGDKLPSLKHLIELINSQIG